MPALSPRVQRGCTFDYFAAGFAVRRISRIRDLVREPGAGDTQFRYGYLRYRACVAYSAGRISFREARFELTSAPLITCARGCVSAAVPEATFLLELGELRGNDRAPRYADNARNTRRLCRIPRPCTHGCVPITGPWQIVVSISSDARRGLSSNLQCNLALSVENRELY